MARRLGIDVGGTGMKAAPVETRTGRLTAERIRIATPHPATPDAMAAVARELVAELDWSGPIGAGFPAVVQHGVVRTAANIDELWIGVDAAALFAESTGCEVTVVNDADAAGVAEMRFGAGKGRSGTVIMVTLGTGIGTAVFVDGVLVPNTEFGHLMIRGKTAEARAAESVRERKDLSWKEWADRLEEVFLELERLFWPDLFIVGGGVSKKSDKFLPHLGLRAEVVAAEMHNEAGVVGAALSAVAPRKPRQSRR